MNKKNSIKKLSYRYISNSYLETINHKSTKKFILFSKSGKKIKTKKDLALYIKNLSSNQYIFGIYDNKKHLANFKITIKKQVAEIGFLVFLKYRGKKLIYKNFKKIKNLNLLKKNKIKYLILGVDKKNQRAIKLYKNLGFKFKRHSNTIMNYKL